MTRVVVATPDEAFSARVRSALASAIGATNGEVVHVGDEAATLAPFDAVPVLVERHHPTPDVIALGPGLAAGVALEIARQIDESHPEINVVLVAQASDGVFERALRAGVRDVVAPEASEADIGLALQRAIASAERRRSRLADSAKVEEMRRAIVVVSPKGGSGKTTMATNLAVGLAQQERGRVVLVDLDLAFGDVSSALRIIPQHTIADVLSSEDALDPMTLKVLLTEHDSGLYVLCAPDSPVDGERVTVEHTRAILDFATREFPYVVIDTSAGLDEHTLDALEHATDILMLCTMDVPSVRSLHKVVEALDQLGLTTQRRHFVLNRAQTKVGLSTEDIERTVGMPVDIAVHSSREVPLSMNEGEPLVAASDRRSPVARQLLALVDHFTDAPVGAAHRRGFLRRRRTT